MTLSDYYHRDVPDYYDWMYLDGYTPEQIMYVKHKQMYQDYIERKNTQQTTEPEVIIPRIIVKSVVNIK